jgi:hypothetical protein
LKLEESIARHRPVSAIGRLVHLHGSPS